MNGHCVADSHVANPEGMHQVIDLLSGQGCTAAARSLLQGLPLRVVLTRPAQRQQSLEQKLQEQGWDVLSLPALQLASLDVEITQEFLPVHYDWVMFVSRTAWHLYYSQLDKPWPSNTGIAVVGASTARAILDDLESQDALPQLMMPAAGVSQDSEGLWASLSEHVTAKSRVLIVAGKDGRQWLEHAIKGKGAEVKVLHLYERRVNPVSEAARQTLLQWSSDGMHAGIWLMTSPHGIAALQSSLNDAGLLKVVCPAAFVLTHPRLVCKAVELAQAMAVKAVNQPVFLTDPQEDALWQAFMILRQTMLGQDNTDC